MYLNGLMILKYHCKKCSLEAVRQRLGWDRTPWSHSKLQPRGILGCQEEGLRMSGLGMKVACPRALGEEAGTTLLLGDNYTIWASPQRARELSLTGSPL